MLTCVLSIFAEKEKNCARKKEEKMTYFDPKISLHRPKYKIN
jgi:hypothetical protein